MNKYLVLGTVVIFGLAAACGDDDTSSGDSPAGEAGTDATSTAAAGKGGSGTSTSTNMVGKGGSGASAGKGGSAAAGADEPAADGGKGGTAAGGAGGSAPADTGGAPATGAKDIIETATAAGNFTQLAAALQKAGLVDTLKGAGPLTVF